MSRAMKSKQDSNSTDQFPFAPVFFSIYFSVLLYIFVSVTVGTGHGRVYACSSRPEISVAKVSSTSRSHPRTPRQSSLQWIFPALFRWKRCQSLSTSPRATLRPHINSARGFLSRSSKLMPLFTVSVVGCTIISWECDMKSSPHKGIFSTHRSNPHLQVSCIGSGFFPAEPRGTSI